jgi:predicted O-methyltransferase YrrM
MHFISDDIDVYASTHTDDEPKLLKDLVKETYQKILNPRMLSGHFQGRLLSMISKIKQPKNILEIGTYTGYSTLCLAEGLSKNGTIYTIDKNEELSSFSQKYFDKSKFKENITSLIGDAINIIPTINVKFDLIFIDADKPNYINYYNLIIGKMNSGGIILSDNVLWSGKVTQKLDPKDISTKTLLQYNKILKEDSRIETILLPIRDGLSISRVI